MNTDDPHFGPITSGDPLHGDEGEKNGDSLPNGLREQKGEERNPISPPLPYKPCGAKKRNGEPCRSAAMTNGRCRLHGGLTPSGLASTHFKHGRRTKLYKSLPKTLRHAIVAENDEILADIREEMKIQIGLVDVTLKELGQAYKAKNKKEINKVEDKLRKLILERVNVVMREHKRRLTLKNFVPIDSVIVILTGMLQLILEVAVERLDDYDQARKLTAAIAERIYNLLPDRPTIVIQNPPSSNPNDE